MTVGASEERGRPLQRQEPELFVVRAIPHPSLLMDGHANRIDPAKWQPLIMNFQKLYGVSSTEIVPSRLAEIDEKSYRMPDVDRAHEEMLEPVG